MTGRYQTAAPCGCSWGHAKHCAHWEDNAVKVPTGRSTTCDACGRSTVEPPFHAPDCPKGRSWTPLELELAALLLEVTDELEDAASYAGDYLKQKFGWPELVARGRAAAYALSEDTSEPS